MAIYIFIFLYFLSLSIYYDNKSRTKGKSLWIILSFIILVLFAGLRNRVGGDTVNYQRVFEESPKILDFLRNNNNLIELSQPLWLLIISVLKSLCDNFIVLQFFHAIVFNLLLFRFIVKTTNKPFAALLLIYCMSWITLSFEVMRESLCVVIYLNSLFYLKARQPIKYFLINIPSLFIHYFSFVVIFLTLVAYYLKRKFLVYLILAAVILITVLDVSIINESIIRLSLFLGEDLSDLSLYYLESDNYGNNNLNIFGVILNFIVILPSLLILHSLNNHINRELETKLVAIFILISILSAKITIFYRFMNYLWIIIIIETVNYLYNYDKNKDIKYYIVLLLTVFLVIRDVRDLYRPAWNESIGQVDYDYRYFPYKSIFQDPDPIRESFYRYY